MRCAPGILNESSLPKDAVELLGHSSSERIGRLVTDVVHQTIDGGMTEIRMSEPVLNALVTLRGYLFEAVYENQIATAEFGKAEGILGGLWEKVRQRPEKYLDLRTVEAEGVDIAAQDFLAGMTDRYAVRLFEQLYIPKPWVETGGGWTRLDTTSTEGSRWAYNIRHGSQGSSAFITSPRPLTMRSPISISASSCSACGS